MTQPEAFKKIYQVLFTPYPALKSAVLLFRPQDRAACGAVIHYASMLLFIRQFNKPFHFINK